jgi:hypothetical protein
MLRYLFQKTPVRRLNNEFRLISLRPFLTIDDYGSQHVDMSKPFTFPHRIELASSDAEISVMPKKSYECADDICMIALTLEQNMDARAWGINNTLREAAFEAARMPEAEYCRYIRLVDPQHKFKNASTVVLENKTEPGLNSKGVLIIDLC